MARETTAYELEQGDVELPGQLDLEPGIPESTAEALATKSHVIARTANCGLGATVSVRDPQTGNLSTSGDPRRSCYALGL